MSVLVVAEKPSVARDLAAVLGAHERGDGILRGNGWVVSWAVGHLVGLAEPHQVDPSWRTWRREKLPMLPTRWPLTVLEDGENQFKILKRWMHASEIESIVCATDAGREGELIFRFIYEAAGAKKAVQRLWISSLTPDAIRRGMDRLRPARDFDGLGQAARGRAQADWLVGMNLTRAYTIAAGTWGEMLSVGRVQTPTLAILVDREREIQAFVPEKYFEVVAEFGAPPTGA
ncbi:MAG: DNA topoisomerase, partial [Myxococcota bacterium]